MKDMTKLKRNWQKRNKRTDMRYIKKTGTQFEGEGRRQTKEFVDSCWCDRSRQYENLLYERSRLGNLACTLVEEQEDAERNSYCCYCMRKLYLNDTEDGHKENVTLEHIVPHCIKETEWRRDRGQYLQFPNLSNRYIAVCFEGELTEIQKRTKLTGLPYPHFVSYHNLVASCDGITFEDNQMQKSRCCNNKRQERFVLPFFLKKDLANGIRYTKKGELDYDEDMYHSEWFDEAHLNLENYWIKLVRRLWYKISQSAYTIEDIDGARCDKALRQDIIDDIDSGNEISAWNENDTAWNLLSEYSWFYQYYKTAN